jgi:CHAT domain-containing protein
MRMRGVRLEGEILFEPLPETRNEVLEIAGIFHVAPQAPDVLLDAHANETEIKKAVLAQYRYIHFATHGYLSGDIQGVKEPVLVLSQVENTGDDDGLLTLSEVLAMNLNADLVTLSSCVSGVGKVVEGEGISNFARAFQHAGARSVVVSLWEIASKETAEYMGLFYRQLKEGTDKKTSLSLARNAIRTRYPHPFYWAPFVLYGERQ